MARTSLNLIDFPTDLGISEIGENKSKFLLVVRPPSCFPGIFHENDSEIDGVFLGEWADTV